MKRLQILLCSSNLACLGSEELLSTGRNERRNDGLLCSENGEKALGLKTAHQWQRSFFFTEIIKALVAARFNLPPSNVKGSISIGVAGTAWAPALENIPALTEEGWTWPASSVWLGFYCLLLRPKFSSRSAWYQAPNIRDSSMVTGDELLCPHGFLKDGEGTGHPRPRGRSSPSSPAEVPSKGPLLQRC